MFELAALARCTVIACRSGSRPTGPGRTARGVVPRPMPPGPVRCVDDHADIAVERPFVVVGRHQHGRPTYHSPSSAYPEAPGPASAPPPGPSGPPRTGRGGGREQPVGVQARSRRQDITGPGGGGSAGHAPDRIDRPLTSARQIGRSASRSISVNCTSAEPERSTSSAVGIRGADRAGQGVDGAAVPPGVTELDDAVRRRLVGGSHPRSTTSPPSRPSAGPGARRYRPAPPRPRPGAGPGRRPRSAAPWAAPPPAAASSWSATPSTSRRRPRCRVATGCPRRARTGCGCPAATQQRCRVDALRSPSRCWSSAARSADALRIASPSRAAHSGRRGQRDPGQRAGLVAEQGQQSGDGGGLAGSGSAREHRDPPSALTAAASRCRSVSSLARPVPVNSRVKGARQPGQVDGGRRAPRTAAAVAADLLLLLPVALQVEQALGEPQRAALGSAGPSAASGLAAQTASQSAASGHGSGQVAGVARRTRRRHPQTSHSANCVRSMQTEPFRRARTAAPGQATCSSGSPPIRPMASAVCTSANPARRRH